MHKVLIVGACGQDGFYLSRYLKSLGYEIWAGVRHDCEHLREIHTNFIYLDLHDFLSVQTAIRKADPDEIYNLGAQSFVPPSWIHPDETFDVNVGGLARILEFVEQYNKKIKVYQASSSEMFGNRDGMSDENTPMIPTSPYGVSKLAAHRLAGVYRQKGLFVCSGICFNHESQMRGPEMVTRKITKHVARWYLGDTDPIKLGSTDTFRDWGYAGDYVKAMHNMMQLHKPDDYVIATGESHTVQQFLEEACKCANVKAKVEFDERFSRSGEIKIHCGCFTKAQIAFGYKPRTTFKELVALMVESDIKQEMINRGIAVEELSCGK